MTELWLKYKDENGAAQRILVEGAKFTIGRTPDNNLGIPLANLSRRHVQIDRFGDIFILSDTDSSNGTTLDEVQVTEPVALVNGSKLNLGGAAEIEIEIIADESATTDDAAVASENADSASSAVAVSASSQSAPGSGSTPTVLLIVAPILGLLVLAGIGVAAFVSFGRNDSQTTKKDGEFIYANRNEDVIEEDFETPAGNETQSATPIPAATVTALPSATPAEIDAVPTPKVSGDADKIERASIAFLSRIAANDTKSFLTGKQIAIVNPKIEQFKNSTALAANLKNAKQNSARIEELARSKNLRAQFVATAALAALGNRQGDVAKTAETMLETLSNLRASLGNELANDNLLIVAAYEQGAAGQNLAMRDTVANLANKFPNVSSRTVRTIWFLRENGNLSDSQYEFALKFLAIGTIAQNPKDFGVQSEALVFN